MVESSPSSSLVMVQAQFVFEFLKVTLDAPSHLHQAYESLERDVFGHRREPKPSRLLFGHRPLDQQPFWWARLCPLVVPMSYAYTDSSETGVHGSLGPITPAHRLPCCSRKLAGESLRRHGLVLGSPAQQLRRPPPA